MRFAVAAAPADVCVYGVWCVYMWCVYGVMVYVVWCYGVYGMVYIYVRIYWCIWCISGIYGVYGIEAKSPNGKVVGRLAELLLQVLEGTGSGVVG